MMWSCWPSISMTYSMHWGGLQQSVRGHDLAYPLQVGVKLKQKSKHLGVLFTNKEEDPLPEFLLRHKDPLLQLVSLQRASGCWLLDADLAAVLKKTSEEVEKAKPASVNSEVWASILALIWLHGFKMDAKEEWELLTLKAASWIKAQNAPFVSECVEAGNTLMGCSVKKEDLGL
ncbi:hypothetical protein CHARACLAT_025619 [Characodon lateralis]|uniref:Uncharacterized protein n=1 Tax=Characodon lateralis TaxID=208331 RepID=A0ABU7DY61_9TELE|nr:hypothetical protein [Characodon lateralis]